MGPPGTPQQAATQGHPVMSPGGQQIQQMGQQMATAAAPGQYPIMQAAPVGTAGNQYVSVPYIATINQQGQQVIQQGFGFPATAIAAGTQQPGGQYIITTGVQAKPGTQGATQMIPVSQTNQKAPSGTFTLTSSGLVPTQAAGATAGQTYMITQPMGGSPTMTPTGQQGMANIAPNTQIKPEPGKQGQSPAASTGAAQTQPMQIQSAGNSSQQQMILPQNMMTYVNPQNPGQPLQGVYQNGQLILRPQDGQTTGTQFMFSSPAGAGQAIQAAPQPQAGIQPNLTQPMPPGLATSMQPLAMTTATGTIQRPPISLPTSTPAGKTQISRAPPTLLPATTTTTATSMTRLPNTFSTQPSPKSKQAKNNLAPRLAGPGRPPNNATAARSVVGTLKSQASNSASPPILNTANSPLLQSGSPALAAGPPTLQTPLTLGVNPALATQPPPSQPPVLLPMQPSTGTPFVTKSSSGTTMMTTSMANANTAITGTTARSLPHIVPSAKNSSAPMGGNNTNNSPAAFNSNNLSRTANNSTSGPVANGGNAILNHVIDGHLIQESSKPFPVNIGDSKGESIQYLFLHAQNQIRLCSAVCIMSWHY